MRKNILTISLLSVITLFTINPSKTFALASGSVVIDPGDIIENTIGEIGTYADVAINTITSGEALSQNIKEYGLDPLATKIAQDMINRASSDTINWINSGFQGGGPGFIVNPDAYLKNIANQEIRIQLDGINKSNDPYKSAVGMALIANIRNERSSVAAQLKYTLTDTVKRETCTPQNLQKIAESQVDSSLSTSNSNSELTRAEKITQAKANLYSRYCTSAAATDPKVQADLQACFNKGGCGGWGSAFAAYDPVNTAYGRNVLAVAKVKEAANLKKDVAKSEITSGLIPEKVCVEKVDASSPLAVKGDQTTKNDVAGPDGDLGCKNWNIKTPVAAIQTALEKAIKGDFGKLTQADELGEIIGNALLNQATKSLYKGLNSALSSKSTSVNISYDNLLVNNKKSLPLSAIAPTPSAAPPVLPAQQQANINKATAYCANIPETKVQYLKDLCKHLKSNQAAKAVDTNFKSFTDSYATSVKSLEMCVQNVETIGSSNPKIATWKDHNQRRTDALDRANIDSLSARTALYPKSILALSTYITSVMESKDEALSSKIIEEYGTTVSDDTKFVPLFQEKLSSVDFSGVRDTISSHDKELPNEVTDCSNYLNQCQQNKAQDPPRDCEGRGPDNGGGNNGGRDRDAGGI